VTTAEAALLRESAAWFDVKLDRQAFGRVEGFLDLLALWNRRIRLTGERDTSTVLRKHVADSFAPASCMPAAGLVVDIGSGAGFPGIILACLRPDLELALIEARRRRVSFLREAIRQIELPGVRVIEARAEDAAADPGLHARAEVVVAKAIRLDTFLALAAPFVAPSGTVVAMQTSRSAAKGIAESPVLMPAGRRDYRLPDGASRSLLFFSPRCSVS
jgi:16S rRNA (guanine527-N7)-methyltransferase